MPDSSQVMTRQDVHNLISEAAALLKDEVAINRVSRQITYSELERRSNRLANGLLRRGAAKGAMVAIVDRDR